MSKCINQKHFNHQKATRRRNALAKRATRQKAVIDPSTAIPRALSGDASALLTPHQRQAKNSNPGANVKLSKKKLKQVKKRARIVTDYNKAVDAHLMEAVNLGNGMKIPIAVASDMMETC